MANDGKPLHAAPDLARLLAEARDPARANAPYRHAPRPGRVLDQLADALGVQGFPDPAFRDRARQDLDWLKHLYKLPSTLRFHPRDHVPAGDLPYAEEIVQVEHYGQINTGAQVETLGSGFARFNAGSGVFSLAGYGMGSTADVRAGPVVLLHTQADPADVVLTSNLVMDLQVQLSASINPAYQAPALASEQISVEIALLLDLDLRNASGAQISRASARRLVKSISLQPWSSQPPFVAGAQEILPGFTHQSSVVSLPVAWEHQFAMPANCTARVGLAVAPFVTATGYRGSPSHRYLGIADGRTSGQVTSVQAVLFT